MSLDQSEYALGYRRRMLGCPAPELKLSDHSGTTMEMVMWGLDWTPNGTQALPRCSEQL